MSHFLANIRHDVRAMHAYLVRDFCGDQIKMDSMENPFTLSPELQAELGKRLGAIALNRYPTTQEYKKLKQSLAEHTVLPDGWDIMLGNGSDELISLLAMACDQPRALILSPMPSFVMYPSSAQLQGLSFVGVPLTPDFELDEDATIQAIKEHRPTITYLAYPNNPTANLWDENVMRRVIAAVAEIGGLVVLDEAYQPFASKSWLTEIHAHPERHRHVLLMRTLSKLGLAGVRLGYLMGAHNLIAHIDKVRPPYNVSSLNCECALFALEHFSVFTEQARVLRDERDKMFRDLTQLLASLPEAKVWKSEGNMLLFRVPDAARTFALLQTNGVLVKNVSTMHVLLNQCLRVSVGTPEENVRFLDALKGSL